MGLRDTIASQVTGAFAIVDDLKTTITVYEQTAGSYDETTGTVTRTTTPPPGSRSFSSGAPGSTSADR
jgi:hypothetical protein